MIEIHPSIDIETFATKIKNSLQRSAEIEELQSMSEIGDMSSFSKAVVYVTVVSVYIDETTYRNLADRAIITESICAAFAEHPKCKDVVSLGNYIVGVFNTAFKNDIDSALDSVGKVMALFNLVNKVYGQTMQRDITYGVGMNYAKALLVKSMGGDTPQYTWSGDAITTAMNLSEKASYGKKVFASYTIYNNLKEDYQKLFTKALLEGYYEANPVNNAMNKWINANV